MDYTEKKLRQLTEYKGIIIDLTVDEVELPNGSHSFREVTHHPGGVAIVAADDDGCVFCVRQYRYPFGFHMVEIPAGKLDVAGETDPLDCARRELAEETGLTASHWQEMGHLLVSPGISSEKLYLFYATGLKAGDAHPDDGEFIDALKIPFPELYRMVLSGEVSDGKTVAAVLKAACMTELGKLVGIGQ